MSYSKNEAQTLTEDREKIKLSYPVCAYPDEVIKRGLTSIDGNKPIDNVFDISFALSCLVLGCEDIDETVKNSCNCLYDYLEFQFELLRELYNQK